MVKPREHRVPMMLSSEELQAIDNWRFENRIPTRSQAIRRLCQIGLIFDENRAEIIGRFRGSFDAASDFLKTIEGTNPREYTDLENKLIENSLSTFNNLLAAVLIVRTTVGIAFNLRESGDFSEILKGIDEIKEQMKNEANQEMMKELNSIVGPLKSED